MYKVIVERPRRRKGQQHIHQRIRDFIAINVELHEGRLVDLADRKYMVIAGVRVRLDALDRNVRVRV